MIKRILIEGGSKRIKFNKNYIFFDIGKVWSRAHRKFLKPQLRFSPGHSRIKEKNYLFIALQGQKWLYHRLLATLFIPNPENKPYVCHKDGNHMNNNLNNLYWGTHQENELDKYKHGTIMNGSKNGNSKLTEKEVLQIRSSYKPYVVTCRDLGKVFNVDQSLIYLIIKRRVWAHI